jgi:hypothetical protein
MEGTMRTFAWALVFVASVSTGVAAQGKGAAQAIDAKTRAELEQARNAIWRAWFAGDVAALNRIIPAALAAGSPRSWEDRAQTITGSKEFAKSGGKLVELRFDSTTIELHGDVATMHARYMTVTADAKGKRDTVRGRAAEVFVRQKGVWLNPFWYLD